MVRINNTNLSEMQLNGLFEELKKYGFVGDTKIVELSSATFIWRKIKFNDDIELLYDFNDYSAWPVIEYSFIDTSIEVFSQGNSTGISSNRFNVYGKDFIAENKSTKTRFKYGDSYFGFMVIPSNKFLLELLEKNIPSSEKLYKEIFVESGGGILKNNIVDNLVSNLANLLYEYMWKSSDNSELLEHLSKEFIEKSFTRSLSKPSDYELAIHAIHTLDNPSLSLVAKHLNVSERTINNIFYKNKATFMNVRKQIILQKAYKLIEMGNSPKQVASKLGYSSTSYLMKMLNL